ncbi:MAG: type I DNA topoisomerase [Paramuribaculum sp.]|nr:type I DNA topoisomerase [Paramuribaculum sp.]
MKNLVIVESPAKAKTIGNFLGPDFTVKSSYGHIRDLRKKDFSLNKEGNFTPEYEVPDDKKQLVKELKKYAKEADTVWLASDEDREGEAIAWHLFDELKLDPKKTHRIVFHEITKDAILNAIKNPRDIDLNLVDAQQARRVLDRIVGFELSPVLWRKIKPALSAGRVQSVAVRLIVEREHEIKRFKSEQYFRVTGVFTTPEGTQIKAELSKRLPDEESALQYIRDCKEALFSVTDVSVKPLKKSPAPPFTTSTLQQEASRKLGYTVSQTMMLAQRLYEAGHITYMRTDSLNLSALAISAIGKEITSKLGEKYHQKRHYHTKSKGAQEAHEAIRPTYIDRRSIEAPSQEQRLYDLIWKRTVASQMADAELEKTTIEITPNNRSEHFTATGETVEFDGFLRIYSEGTDSDDVSTGDGFLPKTVKGEKLEAKNITATERFTLHPPRYTEAALVKKMEELGIGRPSTYAPTISTIQQRDYVEKGDKEGHERQIKIISLENGEISRTEKTEITGADKGKLIPTDIGMVVNDFLTDNFPNILDFNFTASVEERFDKIAEGNADWHNEITDFYDVFHPEVARTEEMKLEHKVGERILGTDPKSGRTVSVKIGRFGPVVQIGESTDAEKPLFASLRKEQSVFDITLEDALKLFELPRSLGSFEDKEVSVNIGRFGPYVKHDGKFVSLPKELEPMAVTLDEAIDLILAKRADEQSRIMATYAEEPELQVLKGRFGPYISFKGNNFKIPKTVADASKLTLEECRELIAKQENSPKRPVRRGSAKKK